MPRRRVLAAAAAAAPALLVAQGAPRDAAPRDLVPSVAAPAAVSPAAVSPAAVAPAGASLPVSSVRLAAPDGAGPRWTTQRVGLLAAAAVGAASGAQAVQSPEAWRRTFGGYGRRLADQAGFIVVEESLRDGLIELTGWRGDARACRRAAATLVPCATARVFTARTREGRARPNLPLVAGIVGATAASLAWRPEGRTGGATATTFVATRLAIAFGATVTVRALREWARPAVTR